MIGFLFTPSLFAQNAPGAEAKSAPVTFRSDRILVKPKRAVPPATLDRFSHGHANKPLHTFKSLGNLQVIQLRRGASVEAEVQRYRRSGLVEYAEPDYILRANVTLPSDPRVLDGTLWGLNNTGQNSGVADADIDAPEAWDTMNMASNIVVAIVDSGVSFSHPDLRDNAWKNPKDGSNGFNALNGSNNPSDDNGHGTLIAGILGGTGNNGQGVCGVAWRVQIMGCKFLTADGTGTSSDALTCIDFARTNGAHVINASWGGPGYSEALYDAIEASREAGIIVVVAAGNSRANNDVLPAFPANFPLDNIVTVAATTRRDQLWSSSNFGFTNVDLAAPGDQIYSSFAIPGVPYLTASGTSLAAPYVTGAFALLQARFPNDTYRERIARLLAATDPLPALAGKCVTGGRLNLANALGPSVVADFTVDVTEGAVPLTVHCTDSSFGAIASRLWDFGDGIRMTNVLNPTHTYTGEGGYTITLTAANDQNVTSTAVRQVQAVANYRMLQARHEWIGAVDTVIKLGDDGVSTAVPLPFPFYFYGKPYDRIFIGANGLLGFNSAGLERSDHEALPNSADANAMLCPFWTDLDPADGGRVQIGVQGRAPHRRFVVTWKSVSLRAQEGGPKRVSFQAVLYESTQQILFQYLHMRNGYGRCEANRAATIGIENETGRVAAQYSFDDSAPLRNLQAIRFVPTSTVGVAGELASALSARSADPGGGIELQLLGAPGRHYMIEASTDLQLWTPIATNEASADGGIVVTDREAANFTQRFYRAVARP